MISLHPLAPWPLVLLGTLLLLAVIWVVARRSGARALTTVVRVLLVLAVAAIWLRPGVGQEPAQARLSDVEVLVVVDRTVSMSAEDYDGEKSRLVGVHSDLNELTQALPGARFALITFGKVARVELPFTSDTAAFNAGVATMRREGAFDGSGSRVDRPLPEMKTLLESADEQHPKRKRIVVFVSDGENTASGSQESFAPLKSLVDGGLVLGYGTASGGRMQVDDPNGPDASSGTSGAPSYITDSSGDVRSKLDADNLRTVADQMGMRYVHRTAPGGMAGLVDGMSGHLRAGGDDVPARYETYWVFALLAVLLAFIELGRDWRGLLGARRQLAAARSGASNGSPSGGGA